MNENNVENVQSAEKETVEPAVHSFRELSDMELASAVESILFVSGEPVYFDELARLFNRDKKDIRDMMSKLEQKYIEYKRGVILTVTDETVQMVSNGIYDDFVVEFLQPTQTRNFSQSMIETLTIVAYKQPVTRSEIDAIRGIRSEYSVTQLIKQGFIQECGRKDVLGRPMMFGTTDKFLRKFGLHSLDELPDFEKFSEADVLSEQE